jgi:hypothetical protein
MTHDVVWRPVSSTKLAGYWLQDLLRSTGRLLTRRVRRTRDRVDSEYNAGLWHRVLTQRAWLNAPSLAEFLAGSDSTLRRAKVAGRVVEIATRDYYKLRLTTLADVIAAQAGAVDELVEIGCGFGYNLFSLTLANRWQRFLGFDISENGIAAARAIAERFNLAERMTFGLLDLTQPDHPNFREIAGKTVFTCFCIEQIPYDVERVIQNIAANHPSRVIHIEPTTELLEPWRPMDLLNYAYVKSVDYQTHLFTAIAQMASRGEVRIVAQQRLGWAPTIHNDGFMIVWEPR